MPGNPACTPASTRRAETAQATTGITACRVTSDSRNKLQTFCCASRFRLI